METPGAPTKQKRRPRKHKPKQPKSTEEVGVISQPASLSLSGSPCEDITSNTLPSDLQRKPSKRNRKRNKSQKSTPSNRIEPIPLDGIFPGSDIYPLTVQTVPKKKRSKGSRSTAAVEKKTVSIENCEIENITPDKIFPSSERKGSLSSETHHPLLENIDLETIFPSSNICMFESNAILRKIHTVCPVNNTKQLKPVRPIAGIENISAASIFPASEQQILSQHEEPNMNPPKPEKSREEIMAEREAKKAAKAAAKTKGSKTEKKHSSTATPESTTGPLQKSSTDSSISEKLEKLHISDTQPGQTNTATTDGTKQLSKAERKALFEAKNPKLTSGVKTDEKKLASSKAERRAIQEAQRAAKADVLAKKGTPTTKVKQDVSKAAPVKPKEGSPSKPVRKTSKQSQQQQPHMVKLFNHLYTKKFAAKEIVNSNQIHPAITKLGLQYAAGTMAGSKARCLAFLNALTQVIKDYETPAEKEFGRGFEEALNPNIAYLTKCRPFSVSMTNALKYIKMYARQLNSKDSDSDQKKFLLDAIDTYVRDQIEKAEEAISMSVQEKIYDGDVILTYGCSPLIKHILEEANRRRAKKFRVIIVDSRPRNGEHEMLHQLVAQGIDCTCVLINAISYVMPEVTKVLLSAHALLANGCVMSRVGTAQIALVAKSYNVSVLVCCETHKFSERVQTDAFVYNEIGNPNDLILNSGTRENLMSNPLADWESTSHLTPLNLHYDVTPPELVTAVVTEVAILPCTSVPVILRIKPSEVGY